MQMQGVLHSEGTDCAEPRAGWGDQRPRMPLSERNVLWGRAADQSDLKLERQRARWGRARPGRSPKEL